MEEYRDRSGDESMDDPRAASLILKEVGNRHWKLIG